MGQTNGQRLQYLWWAGRKRFSGKCDVLCPACGCAETRRVGTKYVVTSLRECPVCLLRFRWPKEDQESNHEYYQKEYSEGFTTTCPSDAELEAFIQKGFRGTDRDFSRYIGVMSAAGLVPGQSVLDFGSSWGYGSWQFQHAGFDVWSYEIGRERAAYAEKKLGCRMVESLDQWPARVDCVVSAHVIEHLPDPRLIWEVADAVLNDAGVLVCFCPNGNPSLESSRGTSYYGDLWGKHHPMVITPEFMLGMSAKMGFRARVFSSPYGLPFLTTNILHGGPDSTIDGDELCMIARRAGSANSI